MNTINVPGSLPGLKTAIAFAIAVSLTAALPVGLLAQESTETEAVAEASLEPAQAACESADDLALIVGFLQDTSFEDDGWVPVVVGAIAGISEARDLLGFAGETYQPLVNDLIVSLEGIRVTVEGLDDEETTGAQIASVGETITEIGEAMDALGTQLREPCPAS